MQDDRPDKFFAGLSVLVSFILLLPVLWFGFGADHGIFSYAVWVWRKFGMAPYAFCFDQAFPGIFLIHYFVQAFIGESVTAFRIFDLAWQTAAGLVIFLVACSTFKDRWAGFMASAFYAVCYVKLGPWDSGQRDGFFTLLYLLSLWLFMRGGKMRADVFSAILAGLLIGFAFLLKPTAALLALIFLALIFRSAKSKLTASIAFIISCGAPSLAVIAYYWRIHALAELYQVLFLFNAKVYSGSMLIPRLVAIKGMLLLRLMPENILIAVGALLAAVLSWKNKNINRSSLFWLALIFLGTYVGYFAQAKYIIYQQAPVWGILCVFAGAGWALLFKILLAKRPGHLNSKILVLSLVLLAANIALIDKNSRAFLIKGARVSPAEGQKMFGFYKSCSSAADYVRLRTRPEDKVQVWGGEAMINFLARRRSPTRFPQTFPLMLKPGRGERSVFQKELAAEFLHELQKDPPSYFLVETMSHPGFGISSDKEVMVNDYPELWKFITTQYLPENAIDFIEIYRLKK